MRTLISFAILAMASAGASAISPEDVHLPGPVSTNHPYLYANASQLRDLASALPRLPNGQVFPGAAGTIRFDLTPSALKAKDNWEASIFGSFAEAKDDDIVIRYRPQTQPGKVPVQIGMRDFYRDPATNLMKADYLGVLTVELEIGKPATIEVHWDSATRSGWINTPAGSKSFAWDANRTFNAANQLFYFNGRRGDNIANFTLKDGAGNTVWERPNVDIQLAASWQRLQKDAMLQAAAFAQCVADKLPQNCDLTKGGRSEITDRARRLALAYNITGADIYLNGAKDHIELINMVNSGTGVPLAPNTLTNPGTGGEWSMAARAGALGIYYDWLYEPLRAQRGALQEAIKKTIAFDNDGTEQNNDLRYSICGTNAFTDSATVFQCTQAPVYTDWKSRADGPSVSNNYISGHTQAAQFGSLLGLLAIYNDRTEVKGLVDIIYRHFKLGYMPARQLIAADGGHPTLFSYNGSSGGDVPDRILVWQRAMELADPSAGLDTGWMSKAVYPYVYALRNDNSSFPASGDNFIYSLGESHIDSLAIAAGQSGDGLAQWFYKEKILADRTMDHEGMVWDRLLQPYAAPALIAPDTLPLAAHFKVGGNVLMRNSWDYANATLLDFKSSSFISENHHHLDQNSFSLHYRAPLLVDSGQYDNYLSSHWKNYYQRTVAHNTMVLFNKDESFTYDGQSWSNDGGQWYGTRPSYPTIEQITTTNALDGIVAFNNVADIPTSLGYAYARGNASKAYSSAKLDQAQGFLRSVVYLRHPDRDGRPTPPTVVVFDSVVANLAASATSLLHTVNEPSMKGSVADNSVPGRKVYDAAGAAGPFTVRNGGGMVTVQPLLPATRNVVLSGGATNSNGCIQATLSATGVLTDGAATGDCRFLVRFKKGTEFVWRNFAPPADAQNGSGDVGNWRVEISPAVAPAAGVPQHFLNVLHVADNDQRTDVSERDLATLLGSAAEATTAGVELADGRKVVFVKNAVPPASLSWSAGRLSGQTLVFGLKPSTGYELVRGSTNTLKECGTSCGTSALISTINGELAL